MLARALAAAIAFFVASPLAAQSHAAPDPAARILHSPWLALRFVQSGAIAPISADDARVTTVRLRAAPFTIMFPASEQNDLYALAASADPAIFEQSDAAAQGDDTQAAGTVPPFFAPYTGMADTPASSGILMLNPQGHHSLSGLRLGPDPARPLFHISQILLVGARLTPIEAQKTPLYLVIWHDADGDEAFGFGEYELFVLDFSAS